jgi:hypothetical protein
MRESIGVKRIPGKTEVEDKRMRGKTWKLFLFCRQRLDIRGETKGGEEALDVMVAAA